MSARPKAETTMDRFQGSIGNRLRTRIADNQKVEAAAKSATFFSLCMVTSPAWKFCFDAAMVRQQSNGENR